MDILDEGFDEKPEAPALGELIDTQSTVGNVVPEAAIRNRAAMGALLSGEPDKVIDKYRLMMKEASEGGEEVTHQQVMAALEEQNRSKSMRHVINILGDRNIPLEQKKSLMDFVQTNGFKEEPATTLHSAALAAASEGEDVRGENARISTVDAMKEIEADRQMRQKLVNQLVASIDTGSTANQVGELATTEVMPFGRNKMNAGIAEEVRKRQGLPTSFAQTVKDFLKPGTTEKELIEKLNGIAPEYREAFAKTVIDSISTAAVPFASENGYAKYKAATNILLGSPASTTGEWTENMITVFDAFFVGSEARALFKGAKALGKAGRAEQAAEQAAKAVSEAPSAHPAQAEIDAIIKRAGETKFPDRSHAVRQKTISNLEKEKEELLGTAGNLAEAGDIRKMKQELDQVAKTRMDDSPEAVKALAKELQSSKKMKFKDAQAAAQKQIDEYNKDVDLKLDRIKSQIESNRVSAQAMDKVADIEKQIAELKRVTKDSPGLKNPIAEQMDRIFRNRVTRIEHPVSPYSIVEQANPAMARSFHNAIVNGDDEIALALTGVNREQAIANNILPQVGSEGGEVLAKVNQDILEATADAANATRFMPDEVGSAVSKVTTAFRDVPNLTINDAMSSFRLDGDRVVVEAHYSTAGGSFSNAQEAKEYAKWALQDYGLKSDEIVVMKKQGLDYVPVDEAALGATEGDYIIKVKTKHEIDTTDVAQWDNPTVKRNFFDRIPWFTSDRKGSIARWLADPASMLDKTITGSASVGVDNAVALEVVLLKPIKELRSTIEGFDSVRRAKVEEYIKEANLKGIKFDPANLTAQGFFPEEIEALRKWKEIHDGHYYLENYDLVRSMRNMGYQVFDSNGTTLYAKSMPKNGNINTVFDPATGSVRAITPSEIDALYNSNGTLAKLRRPTKFGGTSTEHTIVRNTPTEYLRGIRDTDQILNYRDGYFSVYYKAPKFIDEVVRDSKGHIIERRTIGVAGTTEDAELMIKDAMAKHGKSREDFDFGGDVRNLRHADDAYWDVNTASGRIAQRHRGQPLEKPSNISVAARDSFVANPMESAVRAAQSIAGRTTMRPIIDTAKARFVEQYADFIQPVNGVRSFPNSIDEISAARNPYGKGLGDAKIADARTTFEYIRYLENGYINSVDTGYKAMMNVIANVLGKVGLSKLERAALRAGDLSITTGAKGSVFHAYISLNPLRQIILQPHQVIRTLAYNPKGWANGGYAKRISSYLMHKGGVANASSPELKSFIDFVDKSGMVAGVDKNSLVRGMSLAMADSSSKLKRAIGGVASAPTKVGFEAGEKVNQLGHLAAVHEKYWREGLDLADKNVRARAWAEARALSYNMNAAGDLAYTHSSANVILQFLQMPHKAWMQYTNRVLDTNTKIRLAVADTLLWGTPAATIAAVWGEDNLPDNPEHRELLIHGVEAVAYNKFFTMISGEETNIDFSAFSPYDMSGWKRMFSALAEDGTIPMILNSPAGQLWGKENGRIPTAVKTLGRFFTVYDEIEEEDPTTFAQVMKDAAKISSGWNNYLKMSMALENKRKSDAYGTRVDSSVSTAEAYAMLLGFNTASERDMYMTIQKVDKMSKEHRKNVLKAYKDIKQYYQSQLETDNLDVRYMQSVGNKLMRTFANDPVARNIIAKEWSKDIKGKEAQLAEKMIRATGLPNRGELIDVIKTWPVPEEQKQRMIERINAFEQIEKEN